MDLAQDLDAAAAVQLNVQHHRIRLRPQNPFDCGIRRIRFAHHGDAADVAKQADEALADGGRVLDDKDVGAAV